MDLCGVNWKECMWFQSRNKCRHLWWRKRKRYRHRTNLQPIGADEASLVLLTIEYRLVIIAGLLPLVFLFLFYGDEILKTITKKQNKIIKKETNI